MKLQSIIMMHCLGFTIWIIMVWIYHFGPSNTFFLNVLLMEFTFYMENQRKQKNGIEEHYQFILLQILFIMLLCQLIVNSI